MLGIPLLYFKGMRIMMFQLSGFYCNLNPKKELLWGLWVSFVSGSLPWWRLEPRSGSVDPWSLGLQPRDSNIP